MANPRKFSEKIALHHQKQAEETAAFEQIMREVSDATNKVPRGLAPALGPLRAGSLPDVSQVPPVVPPALAKPEDAPLGQYGHPATVPMPTQRGRPAGVGPMRARPQDRKIDTSPYGSTVYLSPPSDSSWRRTNSDSALHQSSAAPIPPQHHQHHQHHVPQPPPTLQHHHYSHSHHGLNTAGHGHSQHSLRRDGNHLDGMMSMIDTNPNRPRSSCEAPRVPGIHIYPSQHDSSVAQIPVSSNTGSLPDLTSVHFPPAPLDHGGSSPYSTSPVSASPATLSPTSVPPLRSGHSPHSPHSPHHSPHSPHHSPHSPHAGSPTSHHTYPNHHTPQNHLSVPNSNRYLHHSKGVTLESSWIHGGYQQQCSPPSLHSSHSNINVPSPTMGVAPSQVGGNSNGGGGYRSPRSPGSSPGGGAGGGGGGDSPHYDAACSQSAADNYYISQALRQHFEQFSMTDLPATSLSYVNNTNQSQFTQATLSGGDGSGGGIGWAGGGGGGCSGAPACLASGSCTCLPPLTPTTIPDIILTDFSNTNTGGVLDKELNSGLVHQFSKELSSGGGGIGFGVGLFTDEDLRAGLDPVVDFDDLQMLSDPEMNVISDPTMEDSFKSESGYHHI